MANGGLALGMMRPMHAAACAAWAAHEQKQGFSSVLTSDHKEKNRSSELRSLYLATAKASQSPIQKPLFIGRMTEAQKDLLDSLWQGPVHNRSMIRALSK